mmetsp:Transcript_1088/g.4195  ORF Transcript_1088/g.4195 Transcript_1088/m.4195 type:complete len:271 (+) Transcript_1088:1415-2227(+)
MLAAPPLGGPMYRAGPYPLGLRGVTKGSRSGRRFRNIGCHHAALPERPARQALLRLARPPCCTATRLSRKPYLWICLENEVGSELNASLTLAANAPMSLTTKPPSGRNSTTVRGPTATSSQSLRRNLEAAGKASPISPLALASAAGGHDAARTAGPPAHGRTSGSSLVLAWSSLTENPPASVHQVAPSLVVAAPGWVPAAERGGGATSPASLSGEWCPVSRCRCAGMLQGAGIATGGGRPVRCLSDPPNEAAAASAASAAAAAARVHWTR